MDMRKLDKVLFSAAIDLMKFMEDVDFCSYDWYDVWTTRIGRMVQRIRYSGHMWKRHLILPLFLPLYLISKYVPELERPFASKTRAPMSMGLVAQSYFMLYRLMKENEYLNKGKRVLQRLIDNQSSGYSGACWGLPFDWQLAKGVLALRGTPCSTIMTYIMDAFLEGYELTSNESYRDIVISSGDFLVNDLNYEKISENVTCASYTPLDMFHIINSNSYVAAALYRICGLTGDENLRRLADELINYVLTEQNEDGSWYYWGSQERLNKSIDSLHQCYIMENLLYCNKINGSEEVKRSIDKGIEYFEANFLHDSYLVSKFPRSPTYLELVDQAEGINLFTALGKLSLARDIIESTIKRFRVKEKPYFCSAITRVRKIRVPYIRWGHSQMLLAILSYLTCSTTIGNLDQEM